MKTWRLEFVLGVAVFAVLGGAGCGADAERPGYVVLPGMVESVPYDSYDANPNTPNGATLLLPPEGTVPVAGIFSYGPGPQQADRAGRELQNPLAPTPANLARGAHEFANKCLVCHGPLGHGDGPIIGRFPNPPSLLAEHAMSLPDGRIFHIITRGQGIMPSHALQVLPEDRWRLVLHVRTLQGASAQAATTTAANTNGGIQ